MSNRAAQGYIVHFIYCRFFCLWIDVQFILTRKDVQQARNFLCILYLKASSEIKCTSKCYVVLWYDFSQIISVYLMDRLNQRISKMVTNYRNRNRLSYSFEL